MDIHHLFNRTLRGTRKERTPNGSGGFDTTEVSTGDFSCLIVPASITERTFARTQVGDMQGAAEVTHHLYFPPDSDVRRNDYLSDPDTSQVFRVVAVVHPSTYDTYVKAESFMTQVED